MRWTKDNVGRLALTYQFSSIVGTLDFSRSLFLVYLLSVGLHERQTGILQAVLFGSTFLLELPTGILADRFGRKSSVITGFGLLALTFFLFPQVTGFASAILVFIFWGAAFALLSGANSALLYDGLKEAGAVDRHLSVISRVRSWNTFLMAAALVAGGWFYTWSEGSIFYVSAACALIGLVLFLRLPEPKMHEVTAQKRLPVVQALQGFLKGRHGRDLVLFIIGVGLIEMVHTPIFIFSQVLFHGVGLDEKGISVVMGAGFLASAVAQHWAPRLHHLSVNRLVALTCAALVLALVGLWLEAGMAAKVVLFLVINSVPSLLFVHTDHYIHERCDSSIRASLLSVQSFINALLIGAGYLLIGSGFDRIGTSRTMLLLILPLLLGLGFTLWHFHRQKGTHETDSAS